MTVSTVFAIIALVVAIVAMFIALNMKSKTSKSSDANMPQSEEGRKIAIVRGTAWVKSTEITAWTDSYTTGG